MTDLLITGAGGTLGSVLMRELAATARDCSGMVSLTGSRPYAGKVWAADLLDARSYQERLVALAPKVIVHLAAVSQPAAAYRDADRARAVNVDVTARLLALAQSLGARFVFVSTDLVFDGESAPYDEDAATEPVSFYGRTKLEAECHVMGYRRGLCVRLPLLYGLPEAGRAATFFETLVASLRRRKAVSLFTDETRTPLWLDDAAHALITLCDSTLTGVVHAGGPERLSRYAMGEQVAEALGVPRDLLIASSRSSLESDEPRARDVSLDSSRYVRAIGAPPGRTMRAALTQMLARGPNRNLS